MNIIIFDMNTIDNDYITASDVLTPDLMMSQHFLPSSKARTLHLSQVMRLTDA